MSSNLGSGVRDVSATAVAGTRLCLPAPPQWCNGPWDVLAMSFGGGPVGVSVLCCHCVCGPDRRVANICNPSRSYPVPLEQACGARPIFDSSAPRELGVMLSHVRPVEVTKGATKLLSGSVGARGRVRQRYLRPDE